LDLRRKEVDIVHIHYATQALPGLLSGRPFVVHCHGSDIRGIAPEGAAGRLIGMFLTRASAVFYSTPDLASWADPFRSDAAFLPNPIDLNTFTPAAVASVDVLVGTKLDPIKGADEIIESIQRIRSLRPDTTFTIISSGPGLERAMAAAGPNSTVIPTVGHSQMPELLRRHRTAIGQFRLGILSQVELEAMGAGVPIATAFRYDDAYSVVPPLMPATNAEEAARSVTTLLDDVDARTALASAARAWVIVHHDASAIARRLVGIYAELLAS
jgi:glycosyltransferase involved in cell wall biosynthesis